MALLLITHNMGIVAQMADRVMVMYAGQIVESGDAKQMVFDPAHPYSKGLMDSIIVPEEGARNIKLTAIPGTPPNLKDPPSGCRFAPRCKYAQPLCVAADIPMREIEEDGRPAERGRSCRCLIPARELKSLYEKERRQASGEDAEGGGKP
jgi:peptide/nickel transport system ATP-binding protein